MEEKNKKYLIVISLDSLSSNDYEVFKDLPNLKSIIEEGAFIKKVETIYPSLTYPIHTTLISGRYPKSHGIVNNLKLQVNRKKQDWFWHERDIKGDTLLKAAKRQNMKTASLFWPVTGRGNIDYNLAEIFPNRWYQNQIARSLFNGTPKLLFHLRNHVGDLLEGIKQPNLDIFNEAAAKIVLKKYKPDLCLIHFTDVDTHRHLYGVDSKEAKEAIIRYDERVGNIIKVLKEEDMWDNSTLVVLSDHSQIDIDTGIKLNILFREENLISLNRKGNISQWKAYMHSCEGSAYIYVKDGNDKITKGKILKILEDFNKNHKGIEKIYSKEEAIKMGADPSCFLILEAERGYQFISSLEGDIIDKTRNNQKANHGFHPSKDNYTTIFMARGPSIKHTSLDYTKIINVGPTLGKIMDIDLKNAEGQVIEDILK